MKIKSYLNGKRVGLLIKKDLFIEKRFVAIISLTISLLIIVASFMSAIGRNNPNFHLSFFTFLMYTVGIIITSKIFSEMHSLKKNHFWYMLPASDLEKTLSRFTISAIIWPVALLILYSVVSVLMGIINRGLIGYGNNPLLPTNPEVWRRIGSYILIQSTFFYGAALFKRHQLIKMGLAITLFFGFLLIVMMIVFRSFMGNNMGEFSFHQFYQWGNNYSQSFNFNIDSETMQKAFFLIKRGLKIFYYFIMAPLFWSLAYLKIRHNEASNGV